MKRIVFFALIFIITLPACEKAFMDDHASADPFVNFDYLWETLDKKYSFFEYKEIDWNEIRNNYRARIHADMSDQELFNILSQMLYELRDGHVNLTTPFDRSRNWDWYLDHPANFNKNVIDRYYLGKNRRITGPLVNREIDSIGYIYYDSFAKEIKPEHIDFLIQDFAGLKGMIIDVRSNGGGSSGNSRILASRYADKRRLVSLRLVKRGPSHDDFYDPLEEYLNPAGPTQFTKPVVVLMNRLSYSATNDFILKMAALPHVTLIGDQSGGGGGIPVDNELPNGWQFRFSATITLAPDGFNVEHGIPPDIYVELDPQLEVYGIDTIIEFAKEYILNPGEMER
jgi:hypothetical protein